MKLMLKQLKEMQVDFKLKVESFSKEMEDLQDEIDKRETNFYERSDSWQYLVISG